MFLAINSVHVWATAGRLTGRLSHQGCHLMARGVMTAGETSVTARAAVSVALIVSVVESKKVH